ncbi:T-box transcription factor tbx5, partial [Rhizophlyctis rosea]
MIVTKAGRCLFPTLRFRALDFDPNTLYSIGIDVVQTDPYKYKFKNNAWKRVGNDAIDDWVPPEVRAHILPDGPKKGSYWKRHTISFSKIKLTNRHNPAIPSSPTPSDSDSESCPLLAAKLPSGHFQLRSFHRYQPRVHLFTHADGGNGEVERVTTFVWKETRFVAVTHYQNEKVNWLKKNYNPHAKGFKDYDTKIAASKLKNRTPLPQNISGLPIATFDTTHQTTHRRSPSSSSSQSSKRSRSTSTITDLNSRKPKNLLSRIATSRPIKRRKVLTSSESENSSEESDQDPTIMTRTPKNNTSPFIHPSTTFTPTFSSTPNYTSSPQAVPTPHNGYTAHEAPQVIFLTEAQQQLRDLAKVFEVAAYLQSQGG